MDRVHKRGTSTKKRQYKKRRYKKRQYKKRQYKKNQYKKKDVIKLFATTIYEPLYSQHDRWHGRGEGWVILWNCEHP